MVCALRRQFDKTKSKLNTVGSRGGGKYIVEENAEGRENELNKTAATK